MKERQNKEIIMEPKSNKETKKKRWRDNPLSDDSL
jgi:hypothetical protein